MPDEQELSKLSVGELKKRLFWCGASAPSGHLEKSDLIAAVRKAQVEKGVKKVEDQRKAEQAKYQTQAGVVRPAPRPLNYEQKQDTKVQEVVDLHILSEEELQRRIEVAGGQVPEGPVGKFFLVACLRNALKDRAQLEAMFLQEAEAVAAEMDAEAAAAACSGGHNAAAMPRPSPVPAAAPAAAAEAAEEPEEQDFEEGDPGGFSAKELRRQLRAYGARGEERLRGLAERPEFVAALRAAVAEWGPPPPRPRPQRAPESGPGLEGEAPAPSSAEASAPAQEPGALLPELALRAAAAAGRAAAEAAEAARHEAAADLAGAGVASVAAGAAAAVADAAGDAAAGAAPGAGARPAPGRRRARVGGPPAAPAGPVAPSARPSGCGGSAASAKRPRESGEVVVSDGEDEVCAVVGDPISIGDDDADKVAPQVQRKARLLGSSRKERLDDARATAPTAPGRALDEAIRTAGSTTDGPMAAHVVASDMVELQFL